MKYQQSFTLVTFKAVSVPGHAIMLPGFTAGQR